MMIYTEALQEPFNNAMRLISTGEYYCILLDRKGLIQFFTDVWKYMDYLEVIEGTFIFIGSSDTSKIKYVEGRLCSKPLQLFNTNIYEGRFRL